MKFQRYLQEEYVDTVVYKQYQSELFVNPSRSELTDLKDASPGGYRFVVDTKYKKIYMVSSEILHEDLFEIKPNLLPNFDFADYYTKGLNTDRVFTGSGEWGKKIISDSWSIHGDIQRYAGNDKTVKKMTKLYNTDMTWINRYIPQKDIKEIIDKLIKRIESFPKKY